MNLENQIFSLRSAIIKAKRQMRSQYGLEDTAARSLQPSPPKDLGQMEESEQDKPVREAINKVEQLRRVLQKDKNMINKPATIYRYPVDKNELPHFSNDLKTAIKGWKKQRQQYLQRRKI